MAASKGKFPVTGATEERKEELKTVAGKAVAALEAFSTWTESQPALVSSLAWCMQCFLARLVRGSLMHMYTKFAMTCRMALRELVFGMGGNIKKHTSSGLS